MVIDEDPTTLSLDELRNVRAKLQHEDDVVSYARRVAQARLDLVNTEMHRRERGEDDLDLPSELRVVLSQHLTGGPARPPRPTDDLSDDPLSQELDSICADHGFSRIEELSVEELHTLAQALAEYERRVSADRRDRFERLDAFSAELVRRYREGEASVDGLLGEF
ncbi:MAG: hypothetical protein ACRDZZ_03395 [Ilumatobacteraceae bacterium]